MLKLLLAASTESPGFFQDGDALWKHLLGPAVVAIIGGIITMIVARRNLRDKLSEDARIREEQRYAKQEERHSEQVAALETKYENMVSDLQKRHSLAIEKIEERYHASIENLKREHCESLRRQEQNYLSRISKLEKQVEELEEENEQRRSENERIMNASYEIKEQNHLLRIHAAVLESHIDARKEPPAPTFPKGVPRS